jgi:hypothetical protein
MSTLACFQDDFRAALDNPASDFLPAEQPSFDIYRNTVMRSCLDALEANFPAVVVLVGREWFRAVAAIHVSQSPPRDGRMFAYGDEFADFLASFPPAGELPYLADVARLDRLWTESLVAADANVLAAADVAFLGPESLGELRLSLHPATRRFEATVPAVSIWQASRAGVAVSAELMWQAEYAIVSRLGNEVGVTAVDAKTWFFLDAIANGASLADAALSTLDSHPGAPIDRLLASLLQAGAFAN